jgi:hypothetical protein
LHCEHNQLGNCGLIALLLQTLQEKIGRTNMPSGMERCSFQAATTHLQCSNRPRVY